MINTSPELILSKVCEYYQVDIKKVKGISKQGDLVKSRQIYAYITYQITNITLEKIGELINRNHSSMTHSIKKIRGFLDTYPQIGLEIKEIKNNITKNSCSIVVCDVDLLSLTKGYSKSVI